MADFVAPSPSFAPPPDVLGSYLRGQMAPIQQQAAIQQITQSQQEMAQRQQIMSQQSQSFPVGQDTESLPQIVSKAFIISGLMENPM